VFPIAEKQRMTGEGPFSDLIRQRQTEDDRVLLREVDVVARLTKGLLEEVLDRMETEAPAAVDTETLNALLSVARRHAGRELCVEPILIELVETVLTRQFDRTTAGRSWRTIAERIATTLFEDPESHARLIRFWSRLLQKTQ
jgi:hypothetical protein